MTNTDLVYSRRDRFAPAADLAALPPLSQITVGDRTLWLATGHAEVRQILGDPAFSTRRRLGVRPAELVGNLMDYDPPEHTRLRSMITHEFTLRRIRRLEPRIEAVVEGCLDGMERAGPPADLVKLFAWPIPIAALCELIGVPRDDRREFERRTRTHLDHTRPRAEQAAAGAALGGYLDVLVTRQRKEPDEGFLGTLIRDHGADITDDELRGVCILLLLAGLDNISGMLGLGALLLLEHPDQRARIQDDPVAVDRAVEELLRYLSVVHAPTPRIALRDVTVGEQLIRAGEHVICSIPMANRDAALGPDLDRFDIDREPVSHVALGHGVHHCLGAALARMELRIAYPALLRRFPGLRLAGPADEVRFRRHSPAYGLERLPVGW